MRFINFNYFSFVVFFLLCIIYIFNFSNANVFVSKIPATSINEKIDKIERKLDIQSKLINQFYQQLSEYQNDINILRGQIQENQYKIFEIKKKQNILFEIINNLNNKSKIFSEK